MRLLNKEDILASIHSADPDSIFIDPLLDETQVGNVTIDLRLGYDFLVSILTRKPIIEIDNQFSHDKRDMESYFQPTRRDVGDRFILYPHQSVLTTTLEYLSIPYGMYIDILSRSSYSRLGIHISSMIQPGFRGVLPIELYNHSNNALELIVGSRLFQIRLFDLGYKKEYLERNEFRKYYGHTRPTFSRASDDTDLSRLREFKRIDQ